jgi:hypothetical protein
MGLDMFLKGKRYLSPYNDQDKPVADELSRKFFSPSLTGLDDEPIRIDQLECSLAYWRKANAIHKWFVDNVQDGEDDCREYYVSVEQLMQLRDICKQILEDPTKASELLPPQAGFFFGGTDVDEWYLSSMQFTHDRINLILDSKEFDDWEVYYQSSW